MKAQLPGRSAGVQLHPTSLPAGRLGDDAYRFVDWLAAAGQSWWQMLPLGPPDRAGSPYKARSAFAAWRGLLQDPGAAVSDDEIDAFRERESFWIDGWEAVAGGRRAVADQVRFDREWGALRRYARECGIGLIGDVPIYVAPHSADHRAWPQLFRGGEVAGAPPDALSASGQLWGNPLYDWPALQRRRYAWWTQRLKRTFELFDVTRIDHFRGFVAYWAVPEDATDARGGRWRRGPGRAVFDAAARELGTLPVIAEDLGVITKPVERLRRSLGFPGMVVMQFGFDPDDPRGPHRLENHERDSVVYTGTHDNDTLRGWFASLPDATRAAAEAQIAAAGLVEPEPWWSIIRLAYSSPAKLAMIQAQDVLGLGSEARMNIPGRATGSWRWRMQPGALTGDLGKRLRAAAEEAGRA
ncbi:MAG TPA: 4-alpha-glucanotransferase [Solirubrobacteraceae bacterium]|nr:4-alpha-glucanotransferase [Solirubrobacteraceae bacterium]